MFEIGVCRFCGAEYLLGKVTEGEGLMRFSRPLLPGHAIDRLLLGEPADR